MNDSDEAVAFFDIFESDGDRGDGGFELRQGGGEGGERAAFVGLRNQGGTCYLNSLLQVLFMTPEFRSGLYSVPDADDVTESPSAQPAELSEGEKTLIAMGFSEQQATAAAEVVGVADLDAAIDFIVGGAFETHMAMRELEQASEKAPPAATAAAALLSPRAAPPQQTASGVLRELRLLFAQLQHGDRAAISTTRLTQSFGWQRRDVFDQHDVHELNRMLFELVERCLQKTPESRIIASLYKGTMLNRVTCSVCGRVSERSDEFLDVALRVKETPSVRAALDELCRPEQMSGDNQYHCEQCAGAVDATRSHCFGELPPLLTLSLQRFDYDFARGTRTKLNSHFAFAERLCMAPYMDGEPSVSPLASAATEKPSAEDDLAFLHGGTCAHGSDACEHCYALVAVVIHSGGCHGGHYRALIRDRTDDSGGWFDFNDSSVRAAGADELAAQFVGSTSAYMLLYRRCTNDDEFEFTAESLAAPEPLRLFVEEENATLRKQREQDEAAAATVDIEIFLPEHVMADAETGRVSVCRRNPLRDSAPAQPIAASFDRRRPLRELAEAVAGDSATHISELHVRGNDVHLSVPGQRELLALPMADATGSTLLRHGTRWLLWNGERLGDVAVARGTLPVEVRYFRSAKNFSIFTVELPDNATVGELRAEVERRVRAEDEAAHAPAVGDDGVLALSMLGARSVTSVTSKDDTRTLVDLFALLAAPVLTCEWSAPPGSPDNFAERSVSFVDTWSEARGRTLKMFVQPVLRWPQIAEGGGGSSSAVVNGVEPGVHVGDVVAVDAAKTLTVAQFKWLALQSVLGVGDDERSQWRSARRQCRVRKYSVGWMFNADEPERSVEQLDLLDDELMTLKACGVDDYGRLLLENVSTGVDEPKDDAYADELDAIGLEGTAATAHRWRVQLLVPPEVACRALPARLNGDGERRTAVAYIPRDASVREAKRLVAAALGVEADSIHLRTMGFFDAPADVLQEGESDYMHEYGVCSGDTLWVGDGSAKERHVELSVQLFAVEGSGAYDECVPVRLRLSNGEDDEEQGADEEVTHLCDAENWLASPVMGSLGKAAMALFDDDAQVVDLYDERSHFPYTCKPLCDVSVPLSMTVAELKQHMLKSTNMLVGALALHYGEHWDGEDASHFALWNRTRPLYDEQRTLRECDVRDGDCLTAYITVQRPEPFVAAPQCDVCVETQHTGEPLVLFAYVRNAERHCFEPLPWELCFHGRSVLELKRALVSCGAVRAPADERELHRALVLAKYTLQSGTYSVLVDRHVAGDPGVLPGDALLSADGARWTCPVCEFADNSTKSDSHCSKCLVEQSSALRVTKRQRRRALEGASAAGSAGLRHSPFFLRPGDIIVVSERAQPGFEDDNFWAARKLQQRARRTGGARQRRRGGGAKGVTIVEQGTPSKRATPSEPVLKFNIAFDE